MTVGQRIKHRRKELGLSADEVAVKLGKNRATVYRYESNEIENLPITILEPMAKVLQTTPAYLMGWEETPTLNKSIQSADLALRIRKDMKAQALLKEYFKLNETGKDKVIDYIKDLADNAKYNEESK